MTGSSASRVHFDPQRSGRRTAAASCEYGLIALETSEAMSLAMAVAQSISFRALKKQPNLLVNWYLHPTFELFSCPLQWRI